MDGKHIPGKGCKCAAWNADDCGCVGVDWRSRRDVEMEAAARELWEALDDIMQCGVVSQSDLKALVGKHAEHFREDNQ